MSTLATPNQLPSLRDLFSAKTKQLHLTLNALQLEDVQTDEAFKATTEMIKGEILLTPVKFGEPTPTKHAPIDENGNLVVTVNIPFTGSSEIFGYPPDIFSHISSNIILPDDNDLSVDIPTVALNKQEVIQKANNKIQTTRDMIRLSNGLVERWHEITNTTIDNLLDYKRKELINFYGK